MKTMSDLFSKTTVLGTYILYFGAILTDWFLFKIVLTKTELDFTN